MEKEVSIYGLPNCTTVRKALDYLDASGVKINKFHNIKEDPLPRARIEELAQLVGGVDLLFSKRALKYREMKLNERNLSEDEMLDLMADEYTFIRRPVLVSGDFGLAGFAKKKYDAFIKS